MTDAELEEIAARAAAATEGEWGVREPDRHMIRGGKGHVLYAYDAFGGAGYANAAFAAAARQDVPALVKELRAARAVLRQVEWAGEAGDWERAGCPACGAEAHFTRGEGPGEVLVVDLELTGHAPGCAIAAALGLEGT